MENFGKFLKLREFNKIFYAKLVNKVFFFLNNF